MRRILALLALFAAPACSGDIQPPVIRNLERPTDIAFACYGGYAISDEAGGMRTVQSAQPAASCSERRAGRIPPGQEAVETAPQVFGFALQSARGTVALLDLQFNAILDADPLTPGKNDIPIGSLPTGLVADTSGCFMVSANAGSCDLSALDVTSALDPERGASVERLKVTAPSGARLAAEPRAIAVAPPSSELGQPCPETPEGSVLVAYPSCHLVAAIDVASGRAVGGVRFGSDGSAALAGDADFACAAECGGDEIGGGVDGGSPADADAGVDGGSPANADAGVDGGSPADADAGVDDGEPSGALAPAVLTVHQLEGRAPRLYIGGEASPILTVVELDSAGLPAAVLAEIRLEGNTGIRDIAVSDRLEMGGDIGQLTAPAGSFQFAYVVATDGSVRVVDLDREVECDTQVDPRLLRDERDSTRLQCLPVGDPETPPRRAGATSPGIALPERASLGRDRHPPRHRARGHRTALSLHHGGDLCVCDDHQRADVGCQHR